MSLLTKKEIHKFAEAVVNDFLGQNIPLNDSVQKLAEARSLNEEQIGRICEAANNLTFNKMFTSKGKTASDRIVEFDVADRKKVLNGLIKSASTTLHPATQEKTAMYELRPLEDERYYARQGKPLPVYEKTASFELRPEAKANPERDRRTLTKTIDHLRHEKLAYDTSYRDKVAELRASFRKLYNDLPFEAFEKQAAALWESDASQVLADLRTEMKLPAVTYDYSLLQKQAGFVNDTHPTMILMKQALELNSTRDRVSRAISKLETSL